MGEHYHTTITFSDDAADEGLAAVLWRMEDYTFMFRLKDGFSVVGCIVDEGPLGEVVHVLDHDGTTHELLICDITKVVYQ